MVDNNPEDLQARIAREEARLARLDEERTQLSRRNSDLKAQLTSLRMSKKQYRPAQQTALPSRPAPSTSAEKVALFMELFRGRIDVYPKRWVNTKKNTMGYSVGEHASPEHIEDDYIIEYDQETR